MNGSIFKLFGGAILIFDLFLVFMFVLGLNSRSTISSNTIKIMPFFFAFLFATTLISVGLIRLHRWAALSASIVGIGCSMLLAFNLGSGTWTGSVVGLPLSVGMLMPFYALTRCWHSLRGVDELAISSFFRGLQSSDPLHLK